MARRGYIKRLRTIVQIGFVLLIAYLTVSHVINRGGPTGSPPLDAYCPFGGIATLYSHFAQGRFLALTGYSNLILLIAVIAVAFVVKNGFCGWVCPFGSVQEWLSRLGRRLFGKQRYPDGGFIPPEKVDRVLTKLKYVILLLILFFTYLTGRLVFRDYDPYIAFLHIGFGHIAWTAYLILGITLVASLFITRPWCRYLCPLGAVMELVGKASLFKVERDPELCKNCTTCLARCPLGINMIEKERVRDALCNGCLECLDTPTGFDALSLRFRGARLPAWGAGLIIVGIIATATFVGKATDTWTADIEGESHQETHPEIVLPADAADGQKPHKPESAGQHRGREIAVNHAGREGVHAGEGEGREEGHYVYRDGIPIQINGRMSLLDIEGICGVPTAYMIDGLGLPPGVSLEAGLGRLKRRHDFSLEELREMIQRYLDSAQ